MDFANAFPWKSEMIFNFYKCISKNFGNRFAICANGFPRFWKCISKILEMDFQFLEMDFQFLEMHFQDFGNGFSIFGNAFQFLEMDFQFGDEFQCISLNLSNGFLIKKLYNFNNFYIFIKNSWLFYGFCIEFLPQNIDD
jgi:hypothetical protein